MNETPILRVCPGNCVCRQKMHDIHEEGSLVLEGVLITSVVSGESHIDNEIPS